jgi:hypothetical protein
MVTHVLRYASGDVVERLGTVAVAQHKAVTGLVAFTHAAYCLPLRISEGRLQVGTG